MRARLGTASQLMFELVADDADGVRPRRRLRVDPRPVRALNLISSCIAKGAYDDYTLYGF